MYVAVNVIYIMNNIFKQMPYDWLRIDAIYTPPLCLGGILYYSNIDQSYYRMGGVYIILTIVLTTLLIMFVVG